jgi:hypothetical protein
VKGFWGSGLVKALEGGSVSMLNVAMTCASAGIIVGVVTLTGLGLKFSSIVLDYADSGADVLVNFWTFFGADRTPVLLHDMRLLLTAFYTCSSSGSSDLRCPSRRHTLSARDRRTRDDQARCARFAAHMFIFYYAVLSGVSAHGPVAIRGSGDHRRRAYRTTMQCRKYTTPAFLIPFMFVLDPSGTGLLLTGSFKTLGQAGGAYPRDDHRGFQRRCAGRRFAGLVFPKTTILERCDHCGVLLVYLAAVWTYRCRDDRHHGCPAEVAGRRVERAAKGLCPSLPRNERYGSQTRNVDRLLGAMANFIATGEQGDPLGMRAADGASSRRFGPSRRSPCTRRSAS